MIVGSVFMGLAVLAIAVAFFGRVTKALWFGLVCFVIGFGFLATANIGPTASLVAESPTDAPTAEQTTAPTDPPTEAPTDSDSSSGDNTAAPRNTISLTKKDAAAFLARADDLYSQATTLVSEDFPTTQDEMDSRIAPGTPYADFQAADHSFQADLPQINLNNHSADAGSLNLMYANLAEFETFVWTGVTAIASCNEEHSKLNMMVAKAFLAEAHRDYNGNGDSAWNPPDITDRDSDTDKCGS